MLLLVFTGSSQYDTALYSMGCSVGLAMVISLLMTSVRYNVKAVEFIRGKHTCYEENIIRQWCRGLIQYRSFFVVLLIVILIAILPLLLLRMLDDDHVYSTHWHIYSWIVSYSFASGSKMGYLIVAIWGVALLTTWCYMVSLVKVRTASASSSTRLANEGRRYLSWVMISISFAANFVLVGGVNALYVLSVTEASLSQSLTLLVQLCMSLFRMVTSVTLVPWLAKQVPDASRRVFFRVGLLLFNNVVVPCLAISLTSSNCFQVTVPLLLLLIPEYYHLICL